MEEDEYEEEERMRRELHAREQFLRQNGQESILQDHCLNRNHWSESVLYLDPPKKSSKKERRRNFMLEEIAYKLFIEPEQSQIFFCQQNFFHVFVINQHSWSGSASGLDQNSGKSGYGFANYC
jgi:hypothetical protein